MLIVPGILTDDTGELERGLDLVVHAKKSDLEVEWVQIDFLDGKYADNRTLGPVEVGKILKRVRDDLSLEAHLMVVEENLRMWSEECSLVGFDRIMSQVESVGDQAEWVSLVKNDWGLEVGLSIDAETSVSTTPIPSLIKRGVTPDVIQVMTVKAGAQGQKFIPETLEKVKDLVRLRREFGLDFQIEVDGGVKVDQVKELQKSGVDLAVVGSGLMKGDFVDNWGRFIQQIKTD